jgi:hypothetical protein
VAHRCTLRGMRSLIIASTIVALGCGTTEVAEPAPAPIPEVLPAPPPAPAPAPEPEPIANCPSDAWSIAANGPNRATESGVEAAGWARGMGSSWERLRACRTIDDFEHLLSCAPVPRGAECGISLPTQRCTAMLPSATLPIVLGQWVDTHDVPSEGSWSCTRR